MTESLNLMGHVKAAIDEWNSITGPTKGLAETIVSRLHFYGYSYNPAKEIVADTYESAAQMAENAIDEVNVLDRMTTEYLAAEYQNRAATIRKAKH